MFTKAVYKRGDTQIPGMEIGISGIVPPASSGTDSRE